MPGAVLRDLPTGKLLDAARVQEDRRIRAREIGREDAQPRTRLQRELRRRGRQRPVEDLVPGGPAIEGVVQGA